MKDRATVEEVEHTIEPRYVVIIRGVSIMAVALTAGKAEVDRLVQPYEGTEITAEAHVLPLPPDVSHDVTGLLETLTGKIIQLEVSEILEVRSELRFPATQTKGTDG